jgi:putative sigma-54 modulation protein
MQIQFTGRQISVTPELRDFTTAKFKRLLRKVDKIISIHVVFAVEKMCQIAEANIRLPGSVIHAKSQSDKMDHAILDLVEKLLTQLAQQTEKH